MPSPADPPPSPDGGPGAPSRASGPICGAKFRAMLACVEKTGAVSACNEQVNEFLSCERHVFHTAIRRSATAKPSPASFTPPLPAAPPPPPGPKVRSAVPTADGNDDEREPYRFLAQPAKSVQRVVQKQFAACASLVDTIRRPSYQTQLLQFNRRMLADMKVTCEIIRTKTLQFVRGLAQSPADDDRKPGNR